MQAKIWNFEYGKTYIELSSCNLEYYQRFLEMTKEL